MLIEKNELQIKAITLTKQNQKQRAPARMPV